MIQIALISIVLGISGIANAQEAEKFSERDGCRIDLGLVAPNEGHAVQFGYNTPVLFKHNFHGQELMYSLNLFGELDYFKDAKVNDDNGSLETSKSWLIGATLEERSAVVNDLIQGYGKMGAIYIKPDSQVYDESNLWGFYLAVGVDIVVLPNRKRWFGDKTKDMTIFAEMSLISGVGRSDGESDNQVASRDFYNGFRPTIGIRESF
ncbi:MAG: hypothetical protein KDD25_03905 [Bdellovibrionales bacterium]|nr:hypothetical protein [Bdellovibrionales bacterium]